MKLTSQMPSSSSLMPSFCPVVSFDTPSGGICSAAVQSGKPKAHSK
jgi:hypothetical protein